MEEEVRCILRQALTKAGAKQDLEQRLVKRFQAAAGGADCDLFIKMKLIVSILH